MDTICRLGILDMIPPGGKTSFADISDKTGLPLTEVKRLLRHAMAMRILHEPEPEVAAHTKVSKFLTIPYINSWVGFESKDTWPGATRVSAQDLHCTREAHGKVLIHTLRCRL